MAGKSALADHRDGEEGRSERLSFRIALAIALLPIPAALLISWSLGSPPWRPPSRDAGSHGASPAPDGPGHPVGPAHR